MATVKKQQLLVDGYFRESQLLLPSDRIIPISLIQICYNYFLYTMWFYKSDTFWTPFDVQDQFALEHAMINNETSCTVYKGSKIVELFENTFGGKMYSLNSSTKPIQYMDVINGSPDEYGACIIDNGSGFIKAGFAGEQIPPYIVFPSVIGQSNKDSNYSIGYSAERESDKLQITHPIKNGIITNWDHMEAIWSYILLNEFRIKPEEHPVLLTERTSNLKDNKEQMTRIMFEMFNIPALYIANNAVLSLYSHGKTTGIVLQSGFGTTHCVPIYEGYLLPHSTNSLDIAGNDLSIFLCTMLAKKGYSFKTVERRKFVEIIKEKLCYVAMDYECEINKNIDQYYRLPDGSVICIGSERFKCLEAMFNPELIGNDRVYSNCFGRERRGIHKLILDSIMFCDIDFRKDLYNNIVIGGGNTMFKGMIDRLEKEIKNINEVTSRQYTVRIITSRCRQYSSWEGGSMLASLSSFNDEWIQLNEYQEIGPSIVHRKCV